MKSLSDSNSFNILFILCSCSFTDAYLIVWYKKVVPLRSPIYSLKLLTKLPHEFSLISLISHNSLSLLKTTGHSGFAFVTVIFLN
jgi:hypothetical protein